MCDVPESPWASYEREERGFARGGKETLPSRELGGRRRRGSLHTNGKVSHVSLAKDAAARTVELDSVNAKRLDILTLVCLGRAEDLEAWVSQQEKPPMLINTNYL